MLHKPKVIEAHFVRQLALVQRLFVEVVPINIIAFKGPLRFKKLSKLHDLAPLSFNPGTAIRGGPEIRPEVDPDESEDGDAPAMESCSVFPLILANVAFSHRTTMVLSTPSIPNRVAAGIA